MQAWRGTEGFFFLNFRHLSRFPPRGQRSSRLLAALFQAAESVGLAFGAPSVPPAREPKPGFRPTGSVVSVTLRGGFRGGPNAPGVLEFG